MRVLSSNKIFLIRNISPEKFGGGETYQLKLAEEFKKHGFAPAILTNSEKLLGVAKRQEIKTFVPPYIKNQNWSGLKNFLLPIYFLRLKRQQKWYEDLFKKEKPDVVNIQSRDDWISATLAAKKLGIKILWTDHADFRNWVLWNVEEKFKNPIGKKIAKLSKVAGKIIFISEYERNWFTSFPSLRKQKNLTVIPNGVKDELAEYEGVKSKRNSFIFLGRIVEEKGIPELLEAFESVSKRFPEATLNIYGSGPELEKYKKMTKDNKNIFFHGETNTPTKALAENEIFVLPSRNEGLSLSLLDAAMMQKTIITTDVGAAEEIVGRDASGGFLIHPDSSETLEKAMLEALKDKEKNKKMAKTARKTYEKKFNLDRIFEEKMLPLYNIDKN
ncbi:glycosyltransferase family 4 protein [Candidatus Saccharibacteria bacterium]|nr:glycosyltransferase family 4 protein [Candidatus Saccharibacteria bacterium]